VNILGYEIMLWANKVDVNINANSVVLDYGLGEKNKLIYP
jgi:hypothetical protein